jgi:hypothetical protein
VSAYSFTKLFSSITESTIWCEPHATVRVWIAMLAKCDRHGAIQASVPGFARLANVTLAECEAAIATLLAPDAYSRTPDNEGRRIEVIEGGWRLLNHAKYRDMRDEEARRQQNREAQRRHRAGITCADVSADSADGNHGVSGTPPMSVHTDTDADTYPEQELSKSKGRSAPVVLPEWLPADAWKDWCDYRNTGKGWTAKARELSLRTLAELHAQGHDPRKVIETAIERGWRGLFAPRADSPPGSAKKPNAAADFRGKSYESTPIDQLPADLRDAAERALRDD